MMMPPAAEVAVAAAVAAAAVDVAAVDVAVDVVVAGGTDRARPMVRHSDPRGLESGCWAPRRS